jgi:hypothetical protein
MTEKKCERCEISFACTPEKINECQCSQVLLSEKTHQFLANAFFDCLCKNCLSEIENKLQLIDNQYIVVNNRFVENIHYYREGHKFVFTEAYLMARGHCCKSACRHCPYGFQK